MCLKAEYDELQYDYVRLKMQTEQEIMSLNLQVQALQKVGESKFTLPDSAPIDNWSSLPFITGAEPGLYM